MPNNNPSGAGAFDFPLRFPGQYFDRETNLAYNLRRDYDSVLGRYIESDPIGLRGGLLTYGYANHNPLTFVDPRGLKPYVFRITVGGGVGLLPFLPIPIVGRVVNLSVTDSLTGETCNYTVACIGVGAGLFDETTLGSHPVTWDDGKECSNCRTHEGTGLAGLAVIPGFNITNWFDVPNGPRLDFSGFGADIALGGRHLLLPLHIAMTPSIAIRWTMHEQ